jgi:dihydroorotase
VRREALEYKCGWSPLEGETLHSTVVMTIMNGGIVYRDGKIYGGPGGRALQFGA